MSDSEPVGQWGGRVTGRVMVDTPRDNSMISIPSHRARTDPPDKRSSIGDGSTFRRANTKSTPPPGSRSTSSPQTTPTSSTWLLRQPRETGPGSVSELPLDKTYHTQDGQQLPKSVSQQQQLQQQKQQPDLQQRQSQQQQERPVSLNQYWIQSQLLPIQQQQEQLQENNRDYFNSDTQLSLKQQFDKEDLAGNALGNYPKLRGNGGTLGLRREDNEGGVTSLQQDISTGNVGNSDVSPSLSRSTPPRFTKCKRQGRVHSSDELKHIGDIAPSNEEIVSEKEKRHSKNENRYTFLLDGNPIDLSLDEARDRPERKSDSYSGAEEIKNHANPGCSQSKDDIICRENRFSADVSSIQSIGTSDGGQTDSRASSKREKKKKKQKRHETHKSKSSLSHAGGTDSLHGRTDDKTDRKDDGGTDSRRTSGASSTKGPRRLAKRGIGMFPSSNWRRLRNTLKAANEMQGTKKAKHPLTREDSFLRKFSTRNHQNVQNASNSTDEDVSRQNFSASGKSYQGRFVIQHDGNFMFYWLGIVTLSVLYNLWTCIAREAFTEIQQGCPACWYSLDALFDVIYICDIIVQFRTGYLDQGLMVYDSKLLRDKYTQSKVVYVDFLSLLPLDLVQIGIGVHPMIRFPRFLKIYRAFRFLHMLESRTAYPNLIRVTNLTHILFLGAHWFAAFYYMISEAEGFTGEWAYPKPVGEFANVNRKYLRSLFWSTLTLTTIGDLPPPDNSNDLRMSNAAYVFVIVSYLIGVFVFATIVGQVGNVINNRNASRQEFERLLDGAKIYMQTHNVPPNLQKRVQRWYDYVWSRGRLNGCDINSLGLLPDKLKTELAIHVNLETLKKVTIFQECQPEFLHDLVLKMKAYIFTPGDLICRRGEVAREMFIIADGVVEIISESGVMLKRMGAGDFFGEIGILNLDGGINRRTADVRSVGYLELFVLSREDVLAALKDHPEAESIIRDYGQRRLREVEAHRQKLKPCRGSTDQQAAGSQTVQNRLLQTLRSLNPAVRRLSSQINHHPGSPPATGQPGNGNNSAGTQRCVTVQSQQRSSPVNKAIPGLAKASANTRAGDVPCDSVSSEQVDAPKEPVSVRFPGNYTGRRRSFGYFRTAYARFRNVFHKRRSQRRSVDMFDTTSRELWGTRSSDEQQGSDDQSGKATSFKGGCNITLNIEKCSANSSSDNPSNVSEEDDILEKEAEEKTSLFPSAKLGSLLMGLQEAENRKPNTKYGKGAYRKLSEPVTYMSVCTEDLDEHLTSRGQNDDQENNEQEAASKEISDVRLISQILEAEGSPPEGEKSLSDAPCTYKQSPVSCEAADDFASPTVPNVNDAKSLSFSAKEKSQNNKDDPGAISPRDSSNDSGNDVRPRSVSFSIKNGQISDMNKPSSVGTDSELSEMLDISATDGSASSGSQRKSMCVTAPPERAASSCLSVPTSNSDSGICGNTENQPPDKSFRLSSSSDPQAMQSVFEQRRKSSSPLRLSEISNLSHTSSDSDDILSGSESPTPSEEDTNDTTALTRASSLHHASVSPFTLSCHCDPADNFTKFISSRLPETFHQRLIKKKKDVMATHIMSASSPKLNTKFPKANEKGNTRRSVRLPPCSPTLSSRSHSFPTLSESFPQTEISGLCASRRSSSQEERHFSFEERVADRSPTLGRLHQNSTKSMDREGSSKGGRSHAMSIIQTPASDLSYQQITAQIQTMQGMIDKRLSQLEEVYSTTTERLDKLAATQDTLVRLLRQQLLSHPDRPRASVEDDDILTASRV